jgi:hypothetical protein
MVLFSWIYFLGDLSGLDCAYSPFYGRRAVQEADETRSGKCRADSSVACFGHTSGHRI